MSTTVNQVGTQQSQSLAFKSKNKKAFAALEKLTNTTQEDALKQLTQKLALEDIRKPVSEEAYVAAHQKAGDFIKQQKLTEILAKDIYKK